MRVGVGRLRYGKQESRVQEAGGSTLPVLPPPPPLHNSQEKS